MELDIRGQKFFNRLNTIFEVRNIYVAIDFREICCFAAQKQSPQHRGTFAAEGMTISKSTRSNLDRIASGQTSYQQVLTELRAKYEKSF